MAGIEGVRVLPGRGIMIAMNHRLVNTVINRCTMPSDGDIIVPIRTVSVIGTTDVHTDDPDDHTVHQNEVDAMLDEGECLVPGFRRRGRCASGPACARSSRTPRPPTPTRATSRAPTRCSTTRERDGVERLRDHDRRQAHDLPADGRGHRRRGLPHSSASRAPCTTATEPLPGSEDGEPYQLGERLARKEERCATSS